jgi:predicted phosphohydrolase
MQFHYVILVLSYISETYLKELPFTHTISVKNYPFWWISCECTEVHQLLPHNSLQILNYLNSGRLQSYLNVVFERLWIMTCTNLYRLKKKYEYVSTNLNKQNCVKYHTKAQGDMSNILSTVTCFLL